jgi:predicted aspartyl protease
MIPRTADFAMQFATIVPRRDTLRPHAQKGTTPKFEKRSFSKKSPRSKTQYVSADDQTQEEETDLPIYTISERSSKPFRADMIVNGAPLSMEIDTGAAVSIISQELQNRVFPDAVLKKSYL